jgi:predicted amidophosphoribosyltransferase
MNAINICFGVFAVLVSMIALRRLYGIWMARPRIAGYGSQTMCRSCGSITPRSKAYCLQCGKPLAAA